MSLKIKGQRRERRSKRQIKKLLTKYKAADYDQNKNRHILVQTNGLQIVRYFNITDRELDAYYNGLVNALKPGEILHS